MDVAVQIVPSDLNVSGTDHLGCLPVEEVRIVATFASFAQTRLATRATQGRERRTGHHLLRYHRIENKTDHSSLILSQSSPGTSTTPK